MNGGRRLASSAFFIGKYDMMNTLISHVLSFIPFLALAIDVPSSHSAQRKPSRNLMLKRQSCKPLESLTCYGVL
jgi:hypothetical protein